jgi:hypothetical protein
MSQTPLNDVKLHSTAIESLFELVCHLHSEGQYDTQMEVASSVNVTSFKHLNTSGECVPICLHPYPVLSIMPNEAAVVELWKMMPELEQHFAILHADYDLIPQLLELPNELNVPHNTVPIKKIGIAANGDERWKCFKDRLTTAGYTHRNFIRGSTSIQLFPLTHSNGDESVFGCGLGGVLVPVSSIEDPDTTKNSYDGDYSEECENSESSDNDIFTPKKRSRVEANPMTNAKLFDDDSSTSSNGR